MSERFIKALFAKLKQKDFNHTVFLKSLYKSAIKEKIDPYDKYIEYLARNKTSDILHDTYISVLLDGLYRDIIQDQSESAFRKKRALDVLSEALESSSVAVDHDPRGENDNPFVEQFDTQTHTSLLSAVAAEQQGGRVIPAARPDAEFATRSERLKLYTANQIDILAMKPNTGYVPPGMEAEQADKHKMIGILSKVYFIDSRVFSGQWTKPPGQRIKLLDTVELKNDDPKPKVVLPSLHFTADYGPVVKTSFTMSSDTPLNEAVALLAKKKRVLYICAGSASCCGGPVQNQECAEMPLYFRTTYPLAIETITQAYPLDAGRCVICPNVLVIKDKNHVAIPHNKYQRIGVMMAPAPFRPKTNLPKNLSHVMDERLFAPDTTYAEATHAHLLHCYFEAALFFGYTNIILDDRGIRENWLPVLATAQLINETVRKFNNRFESITLCLPDAQVRDIMKQTWGLK